MKILCVCLGNICRSPTAEGVLKHLLQGKDDFFVDSAGTSAWHGGERPDGRSTYHASLRGYRLEGESRVVLEKDFEEFDVLLAMDKKNQFDLLQMCPRKSFESKVKLLTDYCVIHEAKAVEAGVPDPYYKGEEGFGIVLDIIEDACTQLVSEWTKEKGEEI